MHVSRRRDGPAHMEVRRARERDQRCLLDLAIESGFDPDLHVAEGMRLAAAALCRSSAWSRARRICTAAALCCASTRMNPPQQVCRPLLFPSCYSKSRTTLCPCRNKGLMYCRETEPKWLIKQDPQFGVSLCVYHLFIFRHRTIWFDC